MAEDKPEGSERPKGSRLKRIILVVLFNSVVVVVLFAIFVVLLPVSKNFAALRRDMLRGVPLGRMVQPEEIAHLAVFLASPAASAITGQAIPVDGGRVMA